MLKKRGQALQISNGGEAEPGLQITVATAAV